MKLSIIICVYNEVKTVNELLIKVLNQELIQNIKKEIIIIDNNSRDGTKNILKKYNEYKNVKIIYQKKNMGKGNSIIEGIKHSSGDLIIFQDADLEYDPKNYNKLIKHLIENNLEAVYGSRILNKNEYHVYKLNRIVVVFFTKLINYFYNTAFTDSATNHKLIKTNILKKLKLISKSFAIDFEITIHLGKHRCKCGEVSIVYNPRKYNEGKKVNFVDAIKGFFIIIYYLFKR